jgi:hypothetical protein
VAGSSTANEGCASGAVWRSQSASDREALIEREDGRDRTFLIKPGVISDIKVAEAVTMTSRQITAVIVL